MTTSASCKCPSVKQTRSKNVSSVAQQLLQCLRKFNNPSGSMRDRTEWIPTLRFIITTVADDKPKWNCGGLSIHRCWNRCSYWSHPGLKMAKSFGNVTTVDSQINRNWLLAGALIKTNQINQREITFKQRQRLRLSEIGAEIAARTCMKRPILHRFFFFLPQTLNEEASTLKWWFKGVWVSILSCQKKKKVISQDGN